MLFVSEYQFSILLVGIRAGGTLNGRKKSTKITGFPQTRIPRLLLVGIPFFHSTHSGLQFCICKIG